MKTKTTKEQATKAMLTLLAKVLAEAEHFPKKVREELLSNAADVFTTLVENPPLAKVVLASAREQGLV